MQPSPWGLTGMQAALLGSSPAALRFPTAGVTLPCGPGTTRSADRGLLKTRGRAAALVGRGVARVVAGNRQGRVRAGPQKASERDA